LLSSTQAWQHLRNTARIMKHAKRRIYRAFTDGRKIPGYKPGVMKTKLTIVIGILSILSQPLSAKGRRDHAPVDPSPAQNKVQIALLLDTSNSMDGLIDQAKTQLWKVVNTFIDARRDGAAPFVEVALYEYGNNSQPVENKYIRLVQPLTRDLDEVSKQMFALKTNGGEEYCGAVIRRSLSDLSWDSNPKTYKAIFIAGNEPFTQGPVDVRRACKDGFAKGIIINSIHCGNRDEGIAGSWHDGAALAGGKFMIIDQDRAVSHIPAPQDERISKLGEELNKTYLGYGKLRQDAAAKQQAVDQSAAENKASGADVQRAVCKASVNYSNASWDIVDAVREKNLDVSTLPKDELPDSLRALDVKELHARIEEAAKQRAAIQSEIANLNKEREAFVAAEIKKQAAGPKTLDEVMMETTRAQAAALGYEFGN
jgi:hypothetical protein